MRKRYEAALAALPSLVPQVYLRPFSALRAAFREGYGATQLRADAMAGLVVGIVALPLSMALAIASGVPPQHGLYTAIIAGAVIAALGGSRTQVSGPTAAFVVILAPIAMKFGVGGLMLATISRSVSLCSSTGRIGSRMTQHPAVERPKKRPPRENRRR
jgi:SulP family sulfate permease